MRERSGEHPGQERDEDAAPNIAPEDGNAEEQFGRAVEAERHRTAARRFFDAAPLYRVEFESDGTVSLRKKGYAYWPNRPPSDATLWKVLSLHPSLEEAERRLRHITSPHVYYDERGRLARMPTASAGESASLGRLQQT